MPTAAEIESTLDGVFAAAEAGDWVTFGSFFAADAVIRQNIGGEQSLDQALVSLPALLSDGTTVRYENVRRFVGEDHAAELHDAVFVKPDGREIRLDICILIEFASDGLIARTHEYLDSGAAAALLT